MTNKYKSKEQMEYENRIKDLQRQIDELKTSQPKGSTPLAGRKLTGKVSEIFTLEESNQKNGNKTE